MFRPDRYPDEVRDRVRALIRKKGEGEESHGLAARARQSVGHRPDGTSQSEPVAEVRARGKIVAAG
jgi:non-homologous end joining protein Ku